MGAQASTTTTRPTILVPQRNFEGTIYRRYVKDTMVTLEFEHQFWSKPHDNVIEIRDITHDKVMFRVPPPRPLDQGGDVKGGAQRKLLLDAYGVPVVGMESQRMLPLQANCTEYTVIPGGYTATNEIFRFTTRFNVFDFPLELRFKKEPPEESTRIVVTNRWVTRTSLVCTQTGEVGTIYKIARVYRVDGAPEGQYRMDIAPGVDLSLIVLFAAAMDEQSYKHLSSIDRRALKDQTKQEKKKKQARP